jgi:hypothetical protein
MNVPKQSMPVMRILPSISYSSQFGVSPSMKIFDKMKQLIRGTGTCTCKDQEFTTNGVVVSPTATNNCNPGFRPQCDASRGCNCVESLQPLPNNGSVTRPFRDFREVQTFMKAINQISF